MKCITSYPETTDIRLEGGYKPDQLIIHSARFNPTKLQTTSRLKSKKSFDNITEEIGSDNDNGYYYKDLGVVEKRRIGGIKMPSIMLEPYYEGRLSDKDRVQYFYDLNFSGVPQSMEHRNKVERMLNEK